MTLTIGEHLVRLGDLLESPVRFVLVVRVLVRMPFQCQFSVAAKTKQTN